MKEKKCQYTCHAHRHVIVKKNIQVALVKDCFLKCAYLFDLNLLLNAAVYVRAHVRVWVSVDAVVCF